jgi:ribose transport system substrate-binding protein
VAQHANLQVRVANAEDQIDKQVNDVQNFISQGVDFIIISPKETAQSLTDAVAQAYSKGVPVIVLDRKVLGDQYTTFIGADNFKIGRAAGEFIRKALGGKGQIVELKGNMSSTPGQLRHKGFLAAIVEDLKSRQIRIVHSADIDWKEDRARSEMESALAANPSIDLVYGHNDPAAHGAYVAARQAGRAEQIKFVGIDALPQEGVAYVKEGVLDATVQYPTGGDRAIQVIIDMIAGRQVPKHITLGTRLFTKQNVNEGGEALN